MTDTPPRVISSGPWYRPLAPVPGWDEVPKETPMSGSYLIAFHDATPLGAWMGVVIGAVFAAIIGALSGWLVTHLRRRR